MLKDSEIFLKRRKLSFSHTTPTATTSVSTSSSSSSSIVATTTPPITPPTGALPQLNMLATMQHARHADAMMTNALSTASTPPTYTPTNMAESLLASAAAAVAAVTDNDPSSSNTVAATQPPALITNSIPATTSAIPLQDHYSLRWNNHQNHILRAFDALLQTKALVDVTLVCAETSIQAHKIVLSACSPFFQRIFAENPCKHPVIVLKDFQGWVVQAIVDFMYRGEISVPQERLQTLIQAGESLQVRGLVESSVPEHTPTPAASPDDFRMLDTSLLSSEIERCSSFDEESPSMVTACSKVILPSRLFGSNARRERERERECERARKRKHECERELERSDLESDQELQHDLSVHSTDLCTSPMPRRKQARPRRRSGELTHELSSQPTSPLQQEHTEQDQPIALDKESTQIEHLDMSLKTVIKSERTEHLEAEAAAGEHDSAACIDSQQQQQQHEAHGKQNYPNLDIAAAAASPHAAHALPHLSGSRAQNEIGGDADDEEDEYEEHDNENGQEDDDNMHDLTGHHDEEEPEDIEELINTSNELRRKSQSGNFDGPEDLCTTKKDNDMSGRHSASDNEGGLANNNNSSKQNNNNRIVLSLKDIRHLNKPSSSSTPNNSNGCAANMNPFAAASLRDLRLERSASAVENQCKMEALEAQMHAAAAAAAAVAASGENPFQHMEHQMDLSLAAAAAAAAVSHHHHHHHSLERDEAMQREQRELQQQHNAYANSILGQMGMPPGMPPFGPGSGPSPHERLEESMNRLTKEFTPASPLSLPTHFNPPDGPPHPPSPLQFPGMSSALALTPPHTFHHHHQNKRILRMRQHSSLSMFGLDSPLGLFPPGIDPGKLYTPLLEMPDPNGMGGAPPPFLKKKMPRPKGQHSAPRGGPPRSWTNAELTEALQHVWNKKMTTSQASRIFGIPYNSLLMYVRGKYGKSLKLEQLRKDCISGPPLELLQMGISGNPNGKNAGAGGSSKAEARERDSHKEQRVGSADMDLSVAGPSGSSGPRSASSEPDLLSTHSTIFNPFTPGFYPDFPGGFPGLPLGMLNLLPPSERHQPGGSMHHMMDEDCKSDRSKQSSMEEEFMGNIASGAQPLALSREERTGRRSASELLSSAGGNSNGSAIIPSDASPVVGASQQNGGTQD